MKKYGERMEKQGKKLKEVADKITEKSEDGKLKNRDKFKRPPKEGRENLVGKFKEKCKEADCSDMKQAFVNADAHKECFSSISKITCGAYCLLVGENGSENAIVDSSGAITGVKVSKEDANAVFLKCAEFFQTMCQMTNVQLVITEMGESGENVPVKKGKSAKIQKVCEKVPELDTCKDDYTKCSDEIQIEFTQSFVSIGKSCAPGEPDENFESTEKDLEAVAAEAGATTEAARLLAEFKARILEEVTTDCGIEFTSSGSSAISAGDSAGIDFAEYSEFASIFSSLFFFFLVTLLK
jgi:hypothetical protein